MNSSRRLLLPRRGTGLCNEAFHIQSAPSQCISPGSWTMQKKIFCIRVLLSTESNLRPAIYPVMGLVDPSRVFALRRVFEHESAGRHSFISEAATVRESCRRLYTVDTA